MPPFSQKWQVLHEFPHGNAATFERAVCDFCTRATSFDAAELADAAFVTNAQFVHRPRLNHDAEGAKQDAKCQAAARLIAA